MSLTTTRAQLVELLDGAGYPTSDHVPGRLTPPLVLLVPADPYVTPGDTYNRGEYVAAFEVHLIAGHARNERVTRDLDAMTDAVLGQLAGTVWDLDRVVAPYVGRVDDREYLASRISISTLYERTP